ncbi:25 kDa ookinete surface antigen precursor, putative [Plasmodium gallinaceum]|uniref:25 kDa ookinete surface antigen, putative n=1 Tax=Plasmodium gallinaceum TaxID=5849 RepID=A0A1J1GXN2_PLAGA|nr:25 kDa ookinete surface antigen precursor, putative [Plasmodium gallinaceum]CRG97324.1 25 kDa ookinete surface antigen precursor, putative [Plasmodium gallinaceum]
MNMSYLFFFFFIQLVLKYINSKVTENTICKDGFLIQMSNHFECNCNPGFVLTSESTCENKVECNANSLDKPCGDFSKCAYKDLQQKELTCKCIDGYDLEESICVPNECKNFRCESGKCVLDPKQEAKIPMCSCFIGIVPSKENNNTCTIEGQTECTLKCTKENETCKKTSGIYKCDCKDGYTFDKEENACISFSLFNILNLSIIFIISLIYFYII